MLLVLLQKTKFGDWQRVDRRWLTYVVCWGWQCQLPVSFACHSNRPNSINNGQILLDYGEDFHLQTWIWIAKFHAFLDSRFWTVIWIDSLTCCNVRCVGHQWLQFAVDFLIPIFLHVDLIFRSGCFPVELSHFTPENQQTSTFALISSAV